MTFVSNAKPPLPMEAGSIFRLQADPSVIIHHYVGCGEAWFLSCRALGFEVEDLSTECFEDAVVNAQKKIGSRIADLTARFMPFVTDRTEITLTK